LFDKELFSFRNYPPETEIPFVSNLSKFFKYSILLHALCLILFVTFTAMNIQSV